MKTLNTIAWSVLAVVLAVITSLGLGLILVGCTEVNAIPEKINKFKEIRILESGMIEGCEYKMFQDPRTGRRILYYYQSMAVLPEEKAEEGR